MSDDIQCFFGCAAQELLWLVTNAPLYERQHLLVHSLGLLRLGAVGVGLHELGFRQHVAAAPSHKHSLLLVARALALVLAVPARVTRTLARLLLLAVLIVERWRPSTTCQINADAAAIGSPPPPPMPPS